MKTIPSSRSLRSPPPLATLVIEENWADAELLLLELESAGFKFNADIVLTCYEATWQLESKSYDLVLADYRVPGCLGTDVLELALQRQWNTPFILVTGTLGIQIGAEFIKRGLTDCIPRFRSARLPLTIRRALKEKSREQQKKCAALLSTPAP